MAELRKERQTLRQHGIVFVTAILPDQFPVHLRKTFRTVRSFRRYDLSTFNASDPSLLPEQVLWRSEIIYRAREIVAIAAALTEAGAKEMEVRLRLEQNVLRRFNMIIECPSKTCEKRLWRAEVEAEVEFPGRIARSLTTRRLNRSSCQCAPEERSSHLNKIFSTCADQMTTVDSYEEHPAQGRRRRPDRILGFQETNSFNGRLEKYNLMAGRPEHGDGLETLWETVTSTVVNHEGRPLLFPFLVIEAKTRSGDLFDSCNVQTGMPILKMLKIQEDLQKKSQMTLEYGGPLVWYIAYRGEDWRLSGCYISETPEGPLYASFTLP